LRLNQETIPDFILLFMPPCGPHLTPLATRSLKRSLLVFSTPGGLIGDDLSCLFFTHCQSLITQGSDHPPVLEPHMVLNLPLDECIDNTHTKVTREKRKKETNKKKTQQAIESQTKANRKIT
jgi:hypothetical protein